MQKAYTSLRPSETSLIIQGKIEGFTPQQILLRDELVRSGVPENIARLFIEDFDDMRKNGIPYMKAKLLERGATEEITTYLTDRTLKAYGDVMAEMTAIQP